MNAKKITMEPTQLHPNYATQIAEVIRSNLTPKYMAQRIADFHENDIAQAMELMTKNERAKLYSILKIGQLADVLAYAEKRNDYLAELAIRKRLEVLSRLEPADAVAYLQTLEKKDRNVLLELMDEDIRKELLLLSSFHDDEIGSKMTTNYISIPAGIGVRQAMGELVAMVLSSISGTTVPLLFQKLNVDPAVASGPLITTINDLVAVVTYYGLAWILLIRFLNLA